MSYDACVWSRKICFSDLSLARALKDGNDQHSRKLKSNMRVGKPSILAYLLSFFVYAPS
ncbi:hypothetical protein PGT21_016506 [Puccinia graminis f. sp. tritici]|uniref:Uncharacterized protein n=1 Tax=Puccinia graminis f. sp. tritici TaxID=56615 RepID=A0A5B0LNK1_PUCGR|nr:hypothetical protein PGT21_016506 [Puccinia graminis f. sp. tritici]KAA1130515.1 hypothetical protein PGTUg99_014238 [Puccinia graminis f. sp. tritici]